MSQFRQAREMSLVDLFADFTVGSGGAPTLIAKNSLGVKSITRNSTGNYTVVLTATHVRALAIVETLLSTAPLAPIMAVSSVANVNGSVNNLAPSFTVQFQNSSGVATDPGSGEEVLLAMTFAKSTGS